MFSKHKVKLMLFFYHATILGRVHFERKYLTLNCTIFYKEEFKHLLDLHNTFLEYFPVEIEKLFWIQNLFEDCNTFELPIKQGNNKLIPWPIANTLK